MAPVVDPKNALTDRERELMALAWLCFSEKPKVSPAHSPAYTYQPKGKTKQTKQTTTNPRHLSPTTKNSPPSPA